jgi:hypothetical protein
MMEKGGAEALNDDSCHCKLAKNDESKHDVDQVAGKLGSVKNLTIEWSFHYRTPCTMNVLHRREGHKADVIRLDSDYIPWKSMMETNLHT